MILNVSGRTDIVAFYTDWFMKRYREGFVDVRNPFNPKMISRIDFNFVDAIFFCTKNPIPILKYLKEIDKPMIFHVTLTPYKKNIEPNVISKIKIIEAIKELSGSVGIDNLAVRYDPIFLNDEYNIEYHKRAFARLCSLLNGSVSTIIVSFLDEYKNVLKHQSSLKIRDFTEDDYKEIGLSFSASAKENGMRVQTCFEKRNLCEYGFEKGECLSLEMAYRLTGRVYKKWTARKDKICSCAQMVDIGVYNSCPHFCKYCYANYDEKKVKSNYQQHDPNSSLLIGNVMSDDIIKARIK